MQLPWKPATHEVSRDKFVVGQVFKCPNGATKKGRQQVLKAHILSQRMQPAILDEPNFFVVIFQNLLRGKFFARNLMENRFKTPAVRYRYRKAKK